METRIKLLFSFLLGKTIYFFIKLCMSTMIFSFFTTKKIRDMHNLFLVIILNKIIYPTCL